MQGEQKKKEGDETMPIEPTKYSQIVRVNFEHGNNKKQPKQKPKVAEDPITQKYQELKLKCYKELESLRNELVANKQFKVPQTVYTNQILLKFVPKFNRLRNSQKLQ